MHHMVKKVSHYNLCCNQLKVVVLDSNVCEGTNEKTTEALDFSLKKIDDESSKKILSSQYTNEGGGGTNASLGRELEKLGRTIEEYVIVTCSIYSH